MSAESRKGNSLPASLTVEAATVLPLFVIALLSFTFLFRVMILEHRLQAGMEVAVERASVYVYLARHEESAQEIGLAEGRELEEMILAGGLTAAYLQARTVAAVGAEYLEKSPVVGGALGLNPLGSALPDAEGNIDYVLHYRVRLPFLPGRAGEIALSQRVCRRIWGGTEKSSEEEDREETGQTVYVTESGTVYHVSRDCSHLRLSTRQVMLQDLVHLRSADGSIYYLCEKCGKQMSSAFVYITGEGNRYHTSLDCPSLKRTIREVSLSEVGGMGRCKTCGGK